MKEGYLAQQTSICQDPMNYLYWEDQFFVLKDSLLGRKSPLSMITRSQNVNLSYSGSLAKALSSYSTGRRELPGGPDGREEQGGACNAKFKRYAGVSPTEVSTWRGAAGVVAGCLGSV